MRGQRGQGAYKMWLALAVTVLCVVGFFYQQQSHAPIFGHSSKGAPVQDDGARRAAFQRDGYRLNPVAHFDVRARLLSSERYRVGREADLSPWDFAVGWDRMSEDAVLRKLHISQGGRFYLYRWDDEPPIPPDEIVRSSANMHLIPASADIADRLGDVRPGAIVHLQGWLVDIDARDGWHWRTSRTREDTGAGACEVFYVESIDVEQRS